MNFTFLERWQPQLLAVLRIMAGLLFVEHGAVKLLHFPIAMALPPGPVGILLTVAGVIELVGGALLTVGVFTRLVAFIMSGEMAIGYFLSHFPKSFFPLVNGGDAAVLYCFIFFYIFVAGGGCWSVDRLRR